MSALDPNLAVALVSQSVSIVVPSIVIGLGCIALLARGQLFGKSGTKE